MAPLKNPLCTLYRVLAGRTIRSHTHYPIFQFITPSFGLLLSLPPSSFLLLLRLRLLRLLLLLLPPPIVGRRCFIGPNLLPAELELEDWCVRVCVCQMDSLKFSYQKREEGGKQSVLSVSEGFFSLQSNLSLFLSLSLSGTLQD